ncbi:MULTISPECIES: VWA domain-containing protein [unclassified Rathayibacter]|uniref:VWA domain-containing protein n=1 Tax=unclassified Rathayibacter TaxID=2609250 RepID=UPI000A777720|nr:MULTISPECIES: vWA domain-containing protein [unclassified Rathayibacter]
MTAPLTTASRALPPLRSPVPLRAPRRPPWWLALLLIPLIGAALLTWALADRPTEIAEVALVGPRAPVPLDVVLLLDESGSFSGYSDVRTAAIDQIFEWAPENLRADDTVTIIAFAEDAVLRLPPTPVSELDSGMLLTSSAPVPDGTAIQPAFRTAVDVLGEPTSPRTVIAVTDTIVGDADAARLGELVSRLGATTASVIVPSGVAVDPAWEAALDWEAEFSADALSADATGLAVADALSHATGQTLERSSGR